MCETLNYYSSTEFDHVDKPISYIEKFDEYSLKIFDGGSSSIVIEFCPFCGEKLPKSRRDEWFEEIESLGIDPWKNDIPEKYQTSKWFREKARN